VWRNGDGVAAGPYEEFRREKLAEEGEGSRSPARKLLLTGKRNVIGSRFLLLTV
jgi:hypothetical protein